MRHHGPTPNGVLRAITIIERVGSGLSLIGCVFIIITFLSSKALRKPINRLVFYASFGNILVNIGTLIARSTIDNENSVGCQLQAFLIQQFLPSDALWAFAMSFNVYLTFYHKFDADMLRGMEKWYLLICYGLPLPPALSYIFISTGSRGRIYGNAVLWCWVSPSWDYLRIATFYGPVWLIIVATFFIYIRTGLQIFRKRNQLRKLDGINGSSGAELDLFKLYELYPLKTTEISVTTEFVVHSEQKPSVDTLDASQSTKPAAEPGAYSITITSGHEPSPPTTATISVDESLTNVAKAQAKMSRRPNQEASRAALAYTKCAVLFFTALLVTWIPSSANRVYSIAHEGHSVIPLEILSATVLPLQGFWNALIYIVTSWGALVSLFSATAHRAGLRRASNPSAPEFYSGLPRDRRNKWSRSQAHNKIDDTDSLSEFARNAIPVSSHSRDRAS